MSMDRGDVYLKHVSRNSHNISKPVRKPGPIPAAAASTSSPLSLLDPNSQQPPVYNINKRDFRDVVQKLTGSPAHDRVSAPPATQSRPPSSRLQRIRPPPLPQIANRPPPINQLGPHPQNDAFQRAAQPFTPLPSVHPVAESPVSAYMRFLQNSASSSVPSPLWNVRSTSQNDVGLRAAAPQSSLPQPAESPVSAYMRFLLNSPAAPPVSGGFTPPQHSLQQQYPLRTAAASLSPFPVLPLSPLPFGCILSPRSPYGTLFSPMGQLGLPQLPLSPTWSVPSPRWKGV